MFKSYTMQCILRSLLCAVCKTPWMCIAETWRRPQLVAGVTKAFWLDLSGTPGLRPIGLSPGSWQTSLGLGSMSRYSAQILICITIWKCMLIMDTHDWIVDIHIWLWISRIHNNCRYPWFSYGNNYGYPYLLIKIIFYALINIYNKLCVSMI